jgi:tetratricopeptide (TPR) repeat protein
MRRRVLVAIMALTGTAALAQLPPAGAVGATPKPKSKEEAAAIKKITDAKTDDERIAAVDALITGFPTTAFKATALTEAADSADHKGDFAKAVTYGEMAIEADPKGFYDLILVARELAQHIGKNDLDKEEKLGKVEKYATQALMLIPAAVKPAVGMSDADWNSFKAQQTYLAHLSLGLAADKRGKPDVEVSEYKAALEALPDPVTMARLAAAYNDNKQYSEALAEANKVLGMDNLNPTVKQFVTQEKDKAQKGLGAKK